MFNFTAWPEMLAWPYLMLQGWLPYKDIAIAHNPLMLFDLVIFFKLFGVGIMQLKIYTWLLIAVNACLVYFVSNKFWNKMVAALSFVAYLILLIVFEGNGLWFDLAMTPFAILLFYTLKNKDYLWTGIIFALGFLTKQTFIYFAFPVVYYLFRSILVRKNIFRFILGSGIIFIPFTFGLLYFGILDDYYNWAIKFGILYLPNAVGQISLPNLKQLVFVIFPFLFLLFSTHYSLITFALVGLMGVYPRFELFHFQPALPFVAIVLATTIYSKKNIILKIIISVFFILYAIYGISRQLGDTTRFYESDVQKVSLKITNHTSSISSLYVVNYWDNLYALTNTKPPKPLIPYIPWYLSYNNNIDLIVDNLKSEMVDAIVIGERQGNYPKLYEFVDKFYNCEIVDKKVELCLKN